MLSNSGITIPLRNCSGHIVVNVFSTANAPPSTLSHKNPNGAGETATTTTGAVFVTGIHMIVPTDTRTKSKIQIWIVAEYPIIGLCVGLYWYW